MYPQGWFRPKPCRQCKTEFAPRSPCNMYCSEECRASGSAEAYYKREYGITLKDWDELYAKQNGLCAICLTDGFLMKSGHVSKLMVDHCHERGTVRGLLCHNCNRALGQLQEDVEIIRRAADYVARHKEIDDRQI